jgi:hypothetical protein
MSQTYPIDLISSKRVNFPWTKFYTLFERPEVWAPQLEDGVKMPTRAFLQTQEGNMHREICLVMNGEAALGFVMVYQTGIQSLQGHVAFRLGISGEVKINAVKYVVRSAFRAGFRYIGATIPEYNRPARYLICAAGFEREGVMKKSFLRNGEMIDQILYGVCA